MRKPAENEGGSYRLLLERNARMYGVHFSVDRLGDVYLAGRCRCPRSTPDEIDRVLGCVLEYSDGSFDAAIELGFAGRDRAGVGLAGEAAARPGTSGPRRCRPLTRLTGPDRRPMRRATAEMSACRRWCCSATARASGTSRTCSPAGSTSTCPTRAWPRPRRGGELLAEHGLLPDVRAHLAAAPGDPHRRRRAGRVPTGSGSRCAAAGGSTSGTTARCRARTRRQMREEFGDEQFMLWRRSYDVPPPPIDADAAQRVDDRATPTCRRTSCRAPSA